MSQPEGHDEQVAKLVELTKDARIAFLTTRDEHGHLVGRPMARQDVDLDADLWFITERDSRKVAHIAADPKVGVTLGTSDSWVSLSGVARVVDDNEKLHELWNQFTDAWLPEGPDSPNAVLIHVRADQAEYWSPPVGGRVATLVSLIKSKVTGQRYDGGDNQVVTDL